MAIISTSSAIGPIDTFKATDINLKLLDNSNEQTAVLTYINPENTTDSHMACTVIGKR